MQPLVSKVPIMVVEGNHEIEEQVENKTFAAYSSRFAFPSKESGSSSPFYYSFNAGGIHFIMLGGYVAYNKTCTLLIIRFFKYSSITYINFLHPNSSWSIYLTLSFCLSSMFLFQLINTSGWREILLMLTEKLHLGLLPHGIRLGTLLTLHITEKPNAWR